jgi:hypothetical protein
MQRQRFASIPMHLHLPSIILRSNIELELKELRFDKERRGCRLKTAASSA